MPIEFQIFKLHKIFIKAIKKRIKKFDLKVTCKIKY